MFSSLMTYQIGGKVDNTYVITTYNRSFGEWGVELVNLELVDGMGEFRGR